jgi:hypothetical protein
MVTKKILNQPIVCPAGKYLKANAMPIITNRTARIKKLALI